MGKNETDEGTPARPMKVRGLLDIMEAEATGQNWVWDDSAPLAGINFGLGASEEARRLALLGLLHERLAEIDRQLSAFERKRGRPKGGISRDVRRAAAVLTTDDIYYREHGEHLPTQKAAIEHALNRPGFAGG